jgi:hypothetical protein
MEFSAFYMESLNISSYQNGYLDAKRAGMERISLPDVVKTLAFRARYSKIKEIGSSASGGRWDRRLRWADCRI